MLITFFDVEGILYSDFLTTEPDDLLADLQRDPVAYALIRAREETRFVRKNRNCFTTTMHLSTTSRTSGNSQPRLTQPYWNNLPIPLLCLCVTFLFPKLKGIIQEACFEGVEAIKSTVMMEPRGMPEEPFQQCINVEQRRMGKCIRLDGDYFGEKNMYVV